MKRAATENEIRDIRTIKTFVEEYCRISSHGDRLVFNLDVRGLEGVFKKKPLLCHDCAQLLKYAVTMRLICPHDPKPMCKKCSDHCYKPEYRQKMKEVMKRAGISLIKRGRVDLLYHYLR
jgi:hypothetical protein